MTIDSASTDVQLYTWTDGQGATWSMASASISAIGGPVVLPSSTLLEATEGVRWAINNVAFSASGLQSESGVVSLKLGLWYEDPQGHRFPYIHSGEVSARPSGHDVSGDPIPRYHEDRWISPPSVGYAVRFGFELDADQPNGDLKIINGRGRVRFMYERGGGVGG